MSATPPHHTIPPTPGSGRHRGSALPLTLPWRTVALRSAAGLALVAGVGAVTLGPARLAEGAATPATAQAGVDDLTRVDAADLSARLAERASRSGRSELLAT